MQRKRTKFFQKNFILLCWFRYSFQARDRHLLSNVRLTVIAKFSVVTHVADQSTLRDSLFTSEKYDASGARTVIQQTL